MATYLIRHSLLRFVKNFGNKCENKLKLSLNKRFLRMHCVLFYAFEELDEISRAQSGNKFWFREIFVDTLDEFLNYFIQSQTSTPKEIARTNALCCLATSGTNTVGSVNRRIFADVIVYILPH